MTLIDKILVSKGKVELYGLKPIGVNLGSVEHKELLETMSRLLTHIDPKDMVDGEEGLFLGGLRVNKTIDKHHFSLSVEV